MESQRPEAVAFLSLNALITSASQELVRERKGKMKSGLQNTTTLLHPSSSFQMRNSHSSELMSRPREMLSQRYVAKRLWDLAMDVPEG